MIELLRNAELYDPAPQGRRHLLVAGERIVWTGAELPALDRGARVSGDRSRRPPGHPRPIDGHVHLTGGGGEAGPNTRVPPVALSRLTPAESRPPSACSAPTTPCGRPPSW